MVRPGAFIASVDLKDAFFSVPIHKQDQNLLKFLYKGQLYKFTCLPNGYRDAPRCFTKLLKPVFATLRELGYLSVIYIDDSFLTGDTYEECLENVKATIKLLVDLGFTINLKKSSLIPSHSIVFLGYIINSLDMTISLTTEKKEKLFLLAASLLDSNPHTIREVAKFLGFISASHLAVPFSKLHYRSLEQEKIRSLKCNKGNYDCLMFISDHSKKEILWWKENILHAEHHIHHIPPIDQTIYTDASYLGWGAYDPNLPNSSPIQGRWTEEHADKHINELEMFATKYAILSLASPSTNHIRVMSDNTTCISYINKMGGSKSHSCNAVASDIWKFCIENHMWVSAAHIPGKHNIIADKASRVFSDAAEWMIDHSIFNRICHEFGNPTIDLFASYQNKQLDNYVSWHPDPGSHAIDAFTIPWDNNFIYLYPLC